MTIDQHPPVPKHWTRCALFKPFRRLLHGDLANDEKQITLSEFQIVIALIALIPLASAVFVGLYRLSRLALAIDQSKFVITSPRDLDAVGIGCVVRGNTPFGEKKHFVVVTSVSSGLTTVKPAHVHQGEFSSEVTFGDLQKGADDEFQIQAFAADSAGSVPGIPSNALSSNQVRVRRSLPEGRVTITSPADGAVVAREEAIRGQTPFSSLHHYVVVTPLRTRTPFVQDGEVSVNRSDGIFSGKAVFGAVQVGVGEQFSVRVVASRAPLAPGPLVSEEGMLSSDAITVTRRE